MNQMQKTVRIEKITLNVGAGKDQKKLEKGLKLLKSITGIEPIKTFTSKRIPTWGLRPGLPIGCKITLRKESAKEVLRRLLHAKDHILTDSQIGDNGNIAFGISEYIDIKDAKYDPEIGIMGLEVCVTLEKPGYRIKRRRKLKKKLHSKQLVSKEEAMTFMKESFNVKIDGN